MRFDENSSEPVRHERTAAPHISNRREDRFRGLADSADTTHPDAAPLCDSARSHASRLSVEHGRSFDAARVGELRTKVSTGTYSRPDIVDQVARRMLSRGDL